MTLVVPHSSDHSALRFWWKIVEKNFAYSYAIINISYIASLHSTLLCSEKILMISLIILPNCSSLNAGKIFLVIFRDNCWFFAQLEKINRIMMVTNTTKKDL